jgi:hypothetical protein
MLAPGTDPVNKAGATAVGLQTFLQPAPNVQDFGVKLEVLGRGLIPVQLAKVVMEVISGVPYAVPDSKVTMEVVAATTQTPAKPMQRIVWFMPN